MRVVPPRKQADAGVVRVSANLASRYGAKIALAAGDFDGNFTEWLRFVLDAYTAKRIETDRIITASELEVALREADVAATEIRLAELTQRREQGARLLESAKKTATKERETKGLLSAEQVAALYWRQSEDFVRAKAFENGLDPEHVARLAEECFQRARLEQQRVALERTRRQAQTDLRVTVTNKERGA